jgi:RNA-directed DNA polymerase
MGLTNRKRQKNQLELAFADETRSEAPTSDERAELRVADQEPESEGTAERLMEEICEPENLRKALKRVQRNQGAPGFFAAFWTDPK